MNTYSNYDPETITLASLEEVPEELVPLQKALRQFLQVNSKYWSMSSLANFLSIDIHILKRLVGHVGVGTEKAHTILILKPITEAR